jgi:hypothetical protein
VDEAFKKKHSDLIVHYEAHTIVHGLITLSEVAEMKRICDGLFMYVFGKRIQIRAAREQEKE